MNTSVELYKKLYLIRRAEEYIIKHYPEDEMKTPMHMSMGGEHISVGICHALGDSGQVFGTYRSHAPFLARTGNVEKFFAEMYGKVTGTISGKAGSMHLALPEQGYMYSSGIVANCIPVAMGTAFANRYQDNDKIACAFFGDGATNEGSFWESINIAALMKLPVLFVCEDNGYAVHTSTIHRQGYSSLTRTINSFDNWVTFYTASTDVEDILRIAETAVKIIRRRQLPVFILVRYYRYLEHVGINYDFDAGYRSKSEFDLWYARDCLKIQRRRLLESMTEDDVYGIENSIDTDIQDAIQKAKAASTPSADELYKGVFCETN